MKVIATITSRFKGRPGYYGMPVANVQSYSIMSALDSDADQFTMDVGDPDNQLSDLYNDRDSEIRISLAAAISGTRLVPLLKGYADTVTKVDDGTITIQGRDLTAAAVDDTAKPFSWYHARPEVIIKQQALERGISKVKIVPVSPISSIFTDGSESVWAFWYRMVRKRQMWIWAEPDGTLYVNKLNYGSTASYFFGVPDKKHPNSSQWMRVIQAQIQKTTQSRLWEVWVFGTNGKVGFKIIERDPKIQEWIKRPISIITTDSAQTNKLDAIKEAQEELFEGMVGEREVVLHVSDPGFIIRQNRVAYVNIPQLDLQGEWFIVGNQLTGDDNGFIQQVRLREKKYALTRRVPTDPTLTDTGKGVVPGALGANLGISKPDWGPYFVAAAQAWHGAWDFSLFLAGLLGIASKETGFQNERQISGGTSGVEWTPPPSSGQDAAGAAFSGAIGQPDYTNGSNTKPNSLRQWRENFANNGNNPLNPFSPYEAGVGPMQLTDAGLKTKADAKGGTHDEYTGGRWMPEANIWVGAETLASKLQGLPPTTANFWIGIRKYNGSGAAADAYAKDVRQRVESQYLPAVTQAQANAKNQALPANSGKTLKDLGNTAPLAVRKIINFAERQEGKPYQLGAGGPDSYDCSGLVYAAYAAANLDVQIGGRASTWGYWQNKKGFGDLFFVPVDQLEVADMVFFSVPSDGGVAPQHMGIYYGDGQMIVAPHTGSFVQVQSISPGPEMTCIGGMRLKGVWPVAGHTKLNPGPT